MLDKLIVDAIAGRGSDRLLVQMPPRHGKSEYISKHVPPWYLGTYPDRRVILASYGNTFSAKWGRQARNILEEWGSSLFGVSVAQDSKASDNWSIEGRSGGMRTCGVDGGITGEGAHLLLIDDPVKDAKQAASKTYRDNTWEWWQRTISTRLEPGAVVIVLMTRWHEDDLIGRLLADGSEPWVEYKFPAIAEEHDILGRKPGDALWPERYDIASLNRIKRRVGTYGWASLYQQRPSPEGGGIFERDWFRVVEKPVPEHIRNVVRYWDKAATDGDGDWTVGVLIGEGTDQRWYVLDVVRGQWSPMKRDKIIVETAKLDFSLYPRYQIVGEQEPGSSGVESAQRMIRMLSGFDVRVDKVTDSKRLRWQPWAAQLEAGNVVICKGPWNKEFIDEHLLAPNGEHDDQIDAAAGAFTQCAEMATVNLDEWLSVI